jgi:hypothetical protein
MTVKEYPFRIVKLLALRRIAPAPQASPRYAEIRIKKSDARYPGRIAKSERTGDGLLAVVADHITGGQLTYPQVCE